jgi:eukaryotic-like serine/threonine-protein kinase
MSVTPGTRLDSYEILAPIGRGGMGEVYRATDLRLGRTLAVKVMPADVAANPARRERFEREARTVASMR